LPHVLTAAAVRADDEPASFTQRSDAVDLSAPGEQVLAAVPTAFDRDGAQDGYRHVSGTSYAAALVATAAAWLRAERPELEPNQVTRILRDSARDIADPGFDDSTGAGLVQVHAAVRRPAPRPDPREPNDEDVWVDGRFLPAQAPAWSGGRAVSLRAFVDRFEDPRDVYPVRVPARARLRVTARAASGSARVVVYERRRQGRRRLGRSQRLPAALVVSNPRARRATFYVHVFAREARGASYTLTLRRADSLAGN
jgi:hypothetical protein